MYPNMTKFLPFYLDNNGFMQNDKSFMITGKHLEYLCAFLNSKLFRFCYRDTFPELLGGTRELRKIFFDKIYVKQINDSLNSEIASKVTQIQNLVNINGDTTLIYSEIESIISDIYELTEEEIAVINNS